MTRQLISLPLRIGARVAGVWLSAAEQAAGYALAIAQRLSERGRPSQAGDRSPDRIDADLTGPPQPAPRVREPEPATRQDAAAAQQPRHVSEEATLVAELAEPGAQDGAGAEVTVSQPWSDYDRLTAKQVIARLADATAAELAAVRLYEDQNRRRETVLSAVERQLVSNRRTRTT
jgi:hypothetical protein